MLLQIPITGGTERYLDPQLSAEYTLNMYQAQIPGEKELALVSIPGSKTQDTFETAEKVRDKGLFTNFDNLFAVYDNTLVVYDQDLNGNAMNTTLNSTDGYVGIEANNSKQIVFVDNINGYVYDYSSSTPTFNQITDPNFPAQPGDVTFLDGHIIVAQTSTNRWYISNIDDATTWDSLNFAALTSAEEKLVGIRVVARRIFIFGRYMTEVWYNSGNASSFPFVRDNNNVIQYGCASVASIAQAQDLLVWLARQKFGSPSIVVSMKGAPPTKISTPAIEYALQRFSNLESTVGYLYNIDGHTFYLLNNPTDGITFVYDFNTSTWHNQAMLDGSAYFSCAHTYFNNTHYLGHFNAPKLLELNSDFTTNDGENIHCMRITQNIQHPSLQRMQVNYLIVKGKRGSGAPTTTPQGATNRYSDFELDPQLYFSYSVDGGEVFSEPQRASIGQVGQYNWNTVFTDVGETEDGLTLKFETFARAKTIMTKASADIDLRGL